jgi:phospholipid transport system substrate-binding protein
MSPTQRTRTAWSRVFLLLAALAAPATQGAPAVPPDQLVRETADEVLTILRNDPDIAAGDTRKLGELVEEKVLGHFDFERMTRLAVGKHWRQASPEQQAALTSAFRTLLVRTYAVALTQFRDREIAYAPLERLANGDAIVHTTLKSPSGPPVRMDYRMFVGGDAWKVYDILVDGVSLIISYRSLFDSTIEQSGVAGLVSLLEQKNAAAAP